MQYAAPEQFVTSIPDVETHPHTQALTPLVAEIGGGAAYILITVPIHKMFYSFSMGEGAAAGANLLLRVQQLEDEVFCEWKLPDRDKWVDRNTDAPAYAKHAPTDAQFDAAIALVTMASKLPAGEHLFSEKPGKADAAIVRKLRP